MPAGKAKRDRMARQRARGELCCRCGRPSAIGVDTAPGKFVGACMEHLREVSTEVEAQA